MLTGIEIKISKGEKRSKKVRNRSWRCSGDHSEGISGHSEGAVGNRVMGDGGFGVWKVDLCAQKNRV